MDHNKYIEEIKLLVGHNDYVPPDKVRYLLGRLEAAERTAKNYQKILIDKGIVQMT